MTMHGNSYASAAIAVIEIPVCLSFLQAGCSFRCLFNSVRALMAVSLVIVEEQYKNISYILGGILKFCVLR